jgi:hypothetical protein
MSAVGNVLMCEGSDAMADRNRLNILAVLLGVLERLPGMFLSRQVILLSVFFSHTVGMSGFVM